MGPVTILAEPCLPGPDYLDDDSGHGYGAYDMPACDFCAASGHKKGQCCNAIYEHSLGRSSGSFKFDHDDTSSECVDLGNDCGVDQGDCYPGLVCAGAASPTCTLPTDNPEAHAASAFVTWSSTSTSNTTTGGPSCVVVVVGLVLGAALLTLYRSRHRGLFLRRRHHYTAMEPIATRMDV